MFANMTNNVNPNPTGPAQSSDFARTLTRAYTKLTPHNELEAALLLVCPINAAPGIDLYYNDQVVGFRGVKVERSAHPLETALRLRAALEESRELVSDFRDLSAAPRAWVGWYRSGTRLYSTGIYAMFGYPDLSIPATSSIDRDTLVAEFLDTALPPRIISATNLYLTVDGTEITISLPTDPATHFAQVSTPSTDTNQEAPAGPQPGHWDVAEEAAGWVAAALAADKIITVPFGGTEEMVLMDLVATLAGGIQVVVPVSASTPNRSLQIGVPPSRIERLVSEEAPTAPAPGFVVIGRDKTEPGLIARHVESGIFCLFPA